MIDTPKKWLEHSGELVLNDKNVGFFIYNAGGWINIVEVFYSQKTKTLMARRHDLTPQTVSKIAKTKRMSRRIAYEASIGMTEKLILALGKFIEKQERMPKKEESVKEVKKEAKDREVQDWLKKSGFGG